MANKKQLPGLITGLVALLCVAAFMVLGFTTGQWHILWLVFLLIPITAIIGDMLTRDKNKADAFIGLVAVLCAAAFFLLGFLIGMWHLVWLVFLVIPITAIVVSIIKAAKSEHSENVEQSPVDGAEE